MRVPAAAAITPAFSNEERTVELPSRLLYEMTKTMGLKVKTDRQFLQLFSHLLSLNYHLLVQ